MAKYIIDLKLPSIKNAGPKARNDVNYFLQDSGYKLLKLYYPEKYRKGFTKLQLSFLSLSYLIRWFSFFKKGDIVLVQYPIPSAYIQALNHFKKIRQIKVIFLIHDLENYRKEKNIKKDIEELNLADVIISHNPTMTSVLKRENFTKHIVDLNIFDYYTTDPDIYINVKPDDSEKKNKVINYAGNLDPSKSGFVYKLTSLLKKSKISYVLYGINYNTQVEDEALAYKGVFAPEETSVLKGDYGLIWDGNSLETCDGTYGEYLMINNPHKLSLYLSAYRPIIVWSKAAVAKLVIEEKIGIAVNTLEEVEEKLDNISMEDNVAIRQNVLKFGQRVREGYFIKKAISSAELV